MPAKKRRRSWKTSVCGIGVVVFSALAGGGLDPTITKWAGIGLTIATGLGLYFARDNGVTSEDVGAKPKDPQP